MLSAQCPVGVLDSGLGGLSVLRALRQDLPAENFIYCADSGNAPWGDKTGQWVRNRCDTIAHWFLDVHHVKMLVLACNTATAAAADHLREWSPVPVVGIEPAVKPAVKMSRTHVVGVLATAGTIRSERYSRLLSRFSAGARVISTPAPGLMECVEKGEFDTPRTRALLTKYLTPITEANADILVLGCTHYPFLTAAIRTIVGEAVKIIEPGPAVAAVARTRLTERGLLKNADTAEAGSDIFFINGVNSVAGVLNKLWPQAASETVTELTV